MQTTIKVSDGLRDRLKAQAAEHGRTLGEHLAALADAEDRAGYRAETAAWDTSAADGLPDEDFSDWPGYPGHAAS